MVNNSSVRYHRKKKKSLRKYQSLSEEEKQNEQQYDCKRYKNLPEYKNKLVQYRTSYFEMWKTALQ